MQRYKCKVCGRTFSNLPEDVLPKKKYSRSAIIQQDVRKLPKMNPCYCDNI